MKRLSKINDLIEKIGNSKISLSYFIFFFLIIISLRNFLEMFFSDYVPEFFLEALPSSIVHTSLFYIALVISTILLFTILLKEKIQKISKIMLTFFSIILLPPIIDLVLSKGKGYDMAYIGGDLLRNFLNFFGGFSMSGITPGIKIEVIMVLLGSFIYFMSKNKGLIKSLFFTFLTYCLIFFYLAFTGFLAIIPNMLNIFFEPSSELMIKIYFLLLFPLTLGIFYLYNRNQLISILRDIRPLRLLFYNIMLFLGIAILIKNYYPLFSIIDSLNILLTMIAIALAWLYSVITNNLEDYESDKVNHRKNSIQSKNISGSEYNNLSKIILIMALLFAASVSFKAFFLIFLFIGNYFIYSMPPVKLKRVPFFSKIIIGLNSFILIILGYTLLGNSLNHFPHKVTLLALVIFSAASNLIDIKDYEGDKAAGIKTLPVLLGLKKSKIFLGTMILIFYFISYFLFFQKSLIGILIILFGLMQFYFITKKNYNEKQVFLTLILTCIGIIIEFIKP